MTNKMFLNLNQSVRNHNLC